MAQIDRQIRIKKSSPEHGEDLKRGQSDEPLSIVRCQWPSLPLQGILFNNDLFRQTRGPALDRAWSSIAWIVSLPPMTSDKILSAGRFPWLPGSGSCGAPPSWLNSNRIFGYPA